ncbi:DUF3991 domain-containing protein [Lactococcus lactis]|uniref:toprim domain-containing protein n=1 Tax=Lactococcus lactis TaxID=1358 RepID=UPI00129380D6|nr:toprim domain-containing protein [Lactococcus lactis]MQQ79391.1 DUF3991 domain-containing protein [Lactococcus lactis]
MDEKIDLYNIPIVSYLLSIGEPIEPISHNYYQHKVHNSLKINISKNYFVWNKMITNPLAKGGVIQYLQIMHNLTQNEAIAKVVKDLKGIKLEKPKQKSYPKSFNYRQNEIDIPLNSLKFLVFNRKLPNHIVKKFFSLNLIQQNERKEIIFKWYKNKRIVGFSRQGTVKLTNEEKEKYHTTRDYFKYVAPTTEENTFWGFNYMEGEPENVYFFESPIDLLSYLAINENQLKNFWLISIDGLAKEKVEAFIKYGTNNFDFENKLKTLNICFDNDEAGRNAMSYFEDLNIFNINFTNQLPVNFKDWNEELINKGCK